MDRTFSKIDVCQEDVPIPTVTLKSVAPINASMLILQAILSYVQIKLSCETILISNHNSQGLVKVI
jgi:hypothetical protein